MATVCPWNRCGSARDIQTPGASPSTGTKTRNDTPIRVCDRKADDGSPAQVAGTGPAAWEAEKDLQRTNGFNRSGWHGSGRGGGKGIGPGGNPWHPRIHRTGRAEPEPGRQRPWCRSRGFAVETGPGSPSRSPAGLPDSGCRAKRLPGCSSSHEPPCLPLPDQCRGGPWFPGCSKRIGRRSPRP
jgi:hypothetical protein